MRKKILALLLCMFILGSSFVQVSAANSTKDTAMNSTQLAAKRFSAKIKNQSEQETAREIMRQLGMAERDIQMINDTYLDMIYNAITIQSNMTYGKIDKNGMETPMEKSECLEAAKQVNLQKQNQNLRAGTATLSLEIDSPTEERDTYFQKCLYILETKNMPKGTLGILCGFAWLNSPLYRCLDAITLSCLDVDFKSGSEFLAFSAVQNTQSLTNPNIKKTENIMEEYDYSQLSAKEMLIKGGHYHAFKYNLPNDLLTQVINTCYEDMSFLVMMNAAPVHVTLPTDFTITASYFHQYVGIEVDIGFNMNDESIDVAFPLNISYWSPKQIAVSCRYRP